MLIIQQHCFSSYRLPVFQKLLAGDAGMKGCLLFGLNPPSCTIKAYRSVEEIPEDNRVERSQYQVLKNRWLYGPILWQSGLLREILRREVKCVLFEGDAYHLSTWCGAFLARLFGKRVGFWTHGPKKSKRGCKALILKVFYRLPAFFLVYGSVGKKNLEQLGVSSDKLYPIHNSLNYPEQVDIRNSVTQEELQKGREELFAHPQLPILLWVGRMTAWRNLDQTISAAAELHKKGERVNLLFVGPGEEQENLKQLATQLGLNEYIHFYGPSYEEKELARIFMLSDLVISPGPIGLTCIHALTYGVPVITSEDPDYQGPEVDAIMPGKTGYFFTKNDISDLGRKISQTLQRQDRTDCYGVIENFFSPDYQCQVINDAINKQPPCDWGQLKKYMDIGKES